MLDWCTGRVAATGWFRRHFLAVTRVRSCKGKRDVNKEAYFVDAVSNSLFVFLGGGGATAPKWAMASLFTRFLDHTRRTTIGRTPLDE